MPALVYRCLPYYARGPVVKGFGRGSKQLGIPTGECLVGDHASVELYFSATSPLVGSQLPRVCCGRAPSGVLLRRILWVGPGRLRTGSQDGHERRLEPALPEQEEKYGKRMIERRELDLISI